jgi:hypothetical protein
MRSRQFSAVGALALILALSACARPIVTAQHVSPASAQQTPLPAMHIWLEIDRWQYTKAEQLCGAPLVAEVVAGAHGHARWNTEDGKRPPLATAGEIIRQGYIIYMPVTFASYTPLRIHGLLPGASFMTIGGQVGQDTYRYGDYPQLSGAGSHYIVVITTPAPREGLMPTDILLVSYAFPIDANGKVTLQLAGDPHEPGVGPVQPEITVALTDLKTTLAQCAA